MSKITQLCNEQFNGISKVAFKAVSTKAVFTMESAVNVGGMSLYLMSNGSRIFLGSLFGRSPQGIEELTMLEGEDYELEIIQGDILKDMMDKKAGRKKAALKLGVFWEAV
ncbi:hypothetical protein [uncultured Alteromonas sp.]|uniref:hypothetical protein n=1 Tax=uncultured Alteromonas sp. TaxID=179113 RepID=UPI0025DE3582|nr:hypothetical protein [uncultured Alteromonas sp.]